MPHPMMYQEDMFVVLESDQPEQFLTPDELFEKLKSILDNYTEDLPRELTKFSTLEEKALHLRDSFCELSLGENTYLQWYVVRLEK
ncbi:MAG: chlororespiratory reduction protein 7 [Snowella sp.]|nr:chlororespiratory reduction protein 7 [Snowella sp.]